MKKLQIRNSLLLFLAATIWGVAFVAQSVGMNYVGPFTFLCTRSFIGGLVLIPCIAFLEKFHKASQKETDVCERGRQSEKAAEKKLLLGGLCCGLVLFAASSFQQIGILYTSVGKAGFITACYILLVPILGLFFKKKCGLFVWIGVVLAVAGLYFLCITEGLRIGTGDILVFVCALLFSVHILVIDYFVQFVDGVKMACIQFWVCGIVSGIFMLLFEEPSFPAILSAWLPILYAGMLSSGVAYTLQIVAQKGMNPTVASLIMSLESVISVLAGLLILGQALSSREILGCVLMFIAIVLAQLPQKETDASKA